MHAQYFRQNPLTVDTMNAQKFFDEDDSGILDDGILDHSAIDSGLELSPPMASSRRDSFAVSASLFSPKTELAICRHAVTPLKQPFLGAATSPQQQSIHSW